MTSVQRTLHTLGAVAVTLLLLWGARALGTAGVLVNLLVPLPAAFVHMRLGTGRGLAIVALTAALLLPLGGGAAPVAYLMQFGVLSFILPLLLRRGWSWDRAVGGTLIVVMGLALVALSGYASARDVTITKIVADYVHGEVDTALVMYRKAELPPDQLAQLNEMARQMGDFMLETWPALAVVATGLVLLFMVLLLSVLAERRYEVPGPPFRRWKTPEALIWLLILAGFAALFAEGPVQLLARNLLVVLLPLYFLHGMAIVAFYFEKKSFTPIIRAIGYLVAAVLNPLPMVVTALGVFDLWVDFRKPRIKKTT